MFDEILLLKYVLVREEVFLKMMSDVQMLVVMYIDKDRKGEAIDILTLRGIINV
jgi:hypothetical protein